MKRKTLKKIKNLLFKKVFNYCNEIDLDDACKNIKRYKSSIQRLKSYCISYEKDQRTGYETYGYKSIKSIESNLVYISDRFVCAFRLSWLVNVDDEVQKLMKETLTQKQS